MFDNVVVSSAVSVLADVSLAKGAAPGVVTTGTNVTYTLTATNNGPDTASSVAVTDTLPSSVSFVSCAATGGGVCGGAGNNRNVTFASLASGQSETVTLVAKVDCAVTDGTIISNTGTISTTTPDNDSSNNSAIATFKASNPPPTISCPASITVDANSAAGTVVTFPTPAASDNCPGATVSCNAVSGSPFPIGTTVVTCIATDSALNTKSCQFNINVRAPLTMKQDIRSQLIALRATVTNKDDAKKLDDAIKEMTDAINPSLWLDPSHPNEKKDLDKVFNEEKDAVNKLKDLIKNKHSTISNAVLQAFIDRIVKADRLLALIAIRDAMMRHGKAKEIAEANKELANGDNEASKGKPDNAIEHYRNAAKHAVKA